MECAWSKDELSGWGRLKLGRMLCKPLEAWVKRPTGERDKILDEAVGTLKDIFILQELDERNDRIEWDKGEVLIAGETLHHLVVS